MIPELELSDISQVGLLLGFISVGLFLLYANFKVIMDEMKRHAKFEQDIEESELSLQNDYKVDQGELDQIKREFAQIESGEFGQKNGEEEDEMADIN